MATSDDYTNSYHHGNLHQALLEAAVTELRNGSVEQLSLRALARHVGVSQAAPYRHFKDKEDLLAQLAIWSFDGLTAALKQASEYQPERTLRQRLRACGEAYIHYALAHPEKYRLMFGRFLPDRHLNPALHHSGEQAFMVLVNLIRQGVDDGILIQQDPQLLAFHLWSSIHGLSSLLIDDFDQCHDGYNESERQQLIQSNLDLLGTGIVRQPPRHE